MITVEELATLIAEEAKQKVEELRKEHPRVQLRKLYPESISTERITRRLYEVLKGRFLNQIRKVRFRQYAAFLPIAYSKYGRALGDMVEVEAWPSEKGEWQVWGLPPVQM